MSSTSDAGGVGGAGAAAAPRGSARRAWVAGVLLALAAAGAHAFAHPGELLHGLSDEALLVPLARKEWDPHLYADDRWLALAEQVFSRSYSWLLGAMLRLADDPVVALRWLALPFQVVFLAGSFRVVERASGIGAAWGGAIALALLPPVLGAALEPSSAGPLAAGAALPRDLVFALLPWLWLARGALPAPAAPWRRLVLFFALGLLANVHPLTAVHLVALLLTLDLLGGPLVPSLVRFATNGVAAALGALPYVLQWTSFPRTPGIVSREVLLWRIEGIGADTPSLWTARMEMPALVVAAACVLGRGRPDPARRALRTLALVALGLAALSPALNAVVAGIQFDRLTRVALWAAVVLAAAELPGALRARDVGALGLAAALAAVGIGGRAAMRTSSDVDRGPFERVARAIEVRVDGGAAARPAPIPDRKRPGDPSADPARRAAFLDVCAWFRKITGLLDRPADWPHPLVAVPPEDWGAFRAYSACGAVVTRKEGGFALSFLGGRGNDWFDEYRGAVVAWVAAEPDVLARWAADRHVHWAVLDAGQVAPAGWIEVHSALPYRVFRVPVE